MGYDYQANADVVAFINTVTKSSDAVVAESIEKTLTNGESSYKSYYWVHRAGQSDNWYNVGQILDTHISAIQTAGYKSVISFRDNGEATNKLPNESASAAAINNNEFSDVNGLYNVTEEQVLVKRAGIKFYHLPLVSGATSTWTVEQYNLYEPVLKEAEANGPVLSHCASGYRSSAYVLAYLASKTDQCTEWALTQSALIGFVFNSTSQSSTDKAVVEFFNQVLKC